MPGGTKSLTTMATAPKIILDDIRALPLAPGDVLVIHAKTLNAEQRDELEKTVRLALWGKPNSFMILAGDVVVGKVRPSE